MKAKKKNAIKLKRNLTTLERKQLALLKAAINLERTIDPYNEDTKSRLGVLLVTRQQIVESILAQRRLEEAARSYAAAWRFEGGK